MVAWRRGRQSRRRQGHQAEAGFGLHGPVAGNSRCGASPGSREHGQPRCLHPRQPAHGRRAPGSSSLSRRQEGCTWMSARTARSPLTLVGIGLAASTRPGPRRLGPGQAGCRPWPRAAGGRSSAAGVSTRGGSSRPGGGVQTAGADRGRPGPGRGSRPPRPGRAQDAHHRRHVRIAGGFQLEHKRLHRRVVTLASAARARSRQRLISAASANWRSRSAACSSRSGPVGRAGCSPSGGQGWSWLLTAANSCCTASALGSAPDAIGSAADQSQGLIATLNPRVAGLAATSAQRSQAGVPAPGADRRAQSRPGPSPFVPPCSGS